MRQLLACGTWAVLLPALAHAALLRTPKVPSARVQRLLVDIDESIHKAGDDADLVFTSLYAYDQQLEKSLRSELVSLNMTLANLNDMRERYHDEIKVSHMDLQQLSSKMEGSKKVVGKLKARGTEANRKFQRVANSVKMLVDILQKAAITPDGKLATLEELDDHGEPPKIFGAIRRMLAANKAESTEFKDVFDAFVPSSLLQTGSKAVTSPVRMTPELLGRTVSALKMIERKMYHRRSQALMQLESKQHRYEGDAMTAGVKQITQEGIEAEKERKAEEIGFSINFTQAVLSLDLKFHKTLQVHIKEKEDLVDSIRSRRAEQRKSLNDLVTLLSGKNAAPSGEENEESQSVSLLETKSETRHPLKMSGLQLKIEDTIKNKGDTHALLLKIKQMLEKSVPVDASHVKSLMKEMGDVLRTVEGEQSKADEAKRRCESQKFHAGQEENQVQANMVLMTSSRNRTLAAIKAAKTNLQGIEKKTSALEGSPSEYERFAAQATKTLTDQEKDRKTIVVAVKKAEEVVGHVVTDAPPVLALMKQLEKDLSTQSTEEQAYRKAESAFQASFVQYVQEYLQLLKERKTHYESSLSALEMYADELGNDSQAQSESLGLSKDLDKESSDLCASVMNFYEARSKRRAELTDNLRNVLPQVPDILSNLMTSDQVSDALD